MFLVVFGFCEGNHDTIIIVRSETLKLNMTSTRTGGLLECTTKRDLAHLAQHLGEVNKTLLLDAATSKVTQVNTMTAVVQTL